MISPDWRAPWFAPYRDVAEPVLARLAVGMPVHAALGHQRFEPAAPLTSGYEQHIAATGSVPTRHNAHDLFNGLVWLRCPALKAALNRAHIAAPPAASGRRGPLRDALTLLDESGLLLRAPAALKAALRAQDWTALFATRRELWRHAQALVVGHALLEKLLAPRKPLCARVLFVDDIAAPGLPPALMPADLPPLPVLGIPGWWTANASRGFYADDQVFRPKRLASAPALGGVVC
ncbi:MULTISPECIES: DUF3025 domain-containing protein [unclassified Roseateles]|uniref:DUF3025 domain-containing protein n=1 Tax=unclassified Roseateles TaxID=2626991 RepID=UPI0006FFA6BF|nr:MULTISPECIES: DUF3025 domain-containing protein [unclassified Roseateles]KQW51560.1 hypothetical protein ASC81_02690 [Pelomonas sp. Root405]KRA77793.1 hypothetical protein ASD88_02690 [Pelomonas sp. Root662]